MSTKSGIELIATERRAQLRKGWSGKHDKAHTDKAIARNARDVLQSYINGPGRFAAPPGTDTWGLGRKHNGDPVKLLRIVGALAAAEIDRIQRMP